MSKQHDLGPIVNLLFEVGILAKTPRSFTSFLGSGQQSVAEHLNRTAYIGFVLGLLEPDVDQGKIIKMCLLHDLAEARTSDLNYVHQKYVESDEKRVIDDLAATLTFGDQILEILSEYKERKTKEAVLAKDADNLEFILSLKEQIDTGNTRASTWVASAVLRLKSPVAKQLAEKIIDTPSDEWWFSDKDDEWWINRKGADNSKRY